MLLENIPQALAQELNIRPEQAKAAIKLLDEGNTVPFIARYRKEATGELEDEQLRKLEERLAYLRNFVKRQEEILNKIAEQGKLTEELQQAIEKTTKLQELEDIYLPFKQKKRTRAQKAREKGLEPLSTTILWQKDTKGSVEKEASKYINPELEVNTWQEAIEAPEILLPKSFPRTPSCGKSCGNTFTSMVKSPPLWLRIPAKPKKARDFSCTRNIRNLSKPCLPIAFWPLTAVKS